ncbi:MAG TPA: PhoH family protein [Pyrinomonadaceae bacterium]|nr:PhoH family protein [Pyrinomonadaceae bacterium]
MRCVVASKPTAYASNSSTLTHLCSHVISEFVAGRKRVRPDLKQIELPPRGLETLFGVHDQNIKYLESLLDVRIDARGQDVSIDGDPQDVATAQSILEDFSELFREGRSFTDKELREAFAQIAEDRAFSLRDYFTKARFNPAGKKQVAPKSANQRKYIQAIQEQDVVFGIGVAGTGKTYLAVALAVQALMQKQVNRIVLARPAVEAGEKLGFLPGDLQEKVDPYLRPLYDALFDLIDYERVTKLLEKQVIEIAPLAFMRGRTLADAFIILDEAQNTTSEQMKMFLTRIGFGSKAVITGDVTQVDLPSGKRSGLIEAERVLKNLNGIEFVYFTEKDVVRHKLVQMIIKAYEEHSSHKNHI